MGVLEEGLSRYQRRGFYSFHTPGHKGRQEFFQGLSFPESDLTELPGLDVLHAPAEIIAGAEKRSAEIFGAEYSIFSRDLSWEWSGDANKTHTLGDKIVVKVIKIKGDTPETLEVEATIKHATEDKRAENLKKYRLQGCYAGEIIDIHRGIVFIKLHLGANAVAHSCNDPRMPGVKDEVQFVVTKIDEIRNELVGVIKKIVRQNKPK